MKGIINYKETHGWDDEPLSSSIPVNKFNYRKDLTWGISRRAKRVWRDNYGLWKKSTRSL
jgi:hypothetical protein